MYLLWSIFLLNMLTAICDGLFNEKPFLFLPEKTSPKDRNNRGAKAINIANKSGGILDVVLGNLDTLEVSVELENEGMITKERNHLPRSPKPKRRRNTCGDFSKCVPLGECPLINDLLDQSCFTSDRYFQRLNSLSCGNRNGEDLVCCPPGGNKELIIQKEDTSTKQSNYVTSGSPDSSNCGESLVRGIEYSGLGSQPWVARIGFVYLSTGKLKFACGGSIIHKRAVLTAAHCALANPDGYSLTSVNVGEWDTETSIDCNDYFCAPPVQNIAVERVIAHPGYEESIFKDDIALIILRDEIKYGVAAAPICINNSPEDLANEQAQLVGWGKLSNQRNYISVQQTLSVPLLGLWHCTAVFKDAIRGREQLCGRGESGEDACAGFGGSPLVLQKNNKWIQIGILSFGAENCGADSMPSVYTNIGHYHSWILRNIESLG